VITLRQPAGGLAGLVTLAGLLTGCAAAAPPSPTVSAAESPPPAAAAAELERAGFRVPGTPLEARRWQDRNGLNLMVASQTLDHHRADGPQPDVATLHVQLVTGLGVRPRLLGDLHDVTGSPCDWDFNQAVVDGSVQVTDTDHDGVGEVTVGWFASCSSDVSPYSVNLALLTGVDEFVLRGQGFVAGGRNAFPEPEASPPLAFTQESATGPWPAGIFDATGRLFRTVFA
jgi:hypothetical protein